MILDPKQYIDRARIALGSLNSAHAGAVFFSQKKTSGLMGSRFGEQSEPNHEQDYGLRIWIKKNDNKCYFALLALGDPQNLEAEIKTIDENNRWTLASDTWPFVTIEDDCFKFETTYRDPQLDLIEPSEIIGRFKNLSKRLHDFLKVPIQNKLIEDYVFHYKTIENEEFFWTNGSKRAISHQSSKFILDLKIKIHNEWVCEGFEEAQYLNLDWSKLSNWAKTWISRLTTQETKPLDQIQHLFFSNYATKQICFATHRWLLSNIKYGNIQKLSDDSKILTNNPLINFYDNPREPKVCGRRVWEGRGRFASGIKFFEKGAWNLDSENDIPTRCRGTKNLPETTLCNLVFSPGRSDFVDLLALSPEGLWIPTFRDVAVQQDGTFIATGLACYYDKNKNVVPIGNVKLMAPLFQMLSQIKDVGRHLQWYHSIGTSDWIVSRDVFNITRE